MAKSRGIELIKREKNEPHYDEEKRVTRAIVAHEWCAVRVPLLFTHALLALSSFLVISLLAGSNGRH